MPNDILNSDSPHLGDIAALDTVTFAVAAAQEAEETLGTKNHSDTPKVIRIVVKRRLMDILRDYGALLAPVFKSIDEQISISSEQKIVLKDRLKQWCRLEIGNFRKRLSLESDNPITIREFDEHLTELLKRVEFFLDSLKVKFVMQTILKVVEVIRSDIDELVENLRNTANDKPVPGSIRVLYQSALQQVVEEEALRAGIRALLSGQLVQGAQTQHIPTAQREFTHPDPSLWETESEMGREIQKMRDGKHKFSFQKESKMEVAFAILLKNKGVWKTTLELAGELLGREPQDPMEIMNARATIQNVMSKWSKYGHHVRTFTIETRIEQATGKTYYTLTERSAEFIPAAASQPSSGAIRPSPSAPLSPDEPETSHPGTHFTKDEIRLELTEIFEGIRDVRVNETSEGGKILWHLFENLEQPRSIADIAAHISAAKDSNVTTFMIQRIESNRGRLQTFEIVRTHGEKQLNGKPRTYFIMRPKPRPAVKAE